MGALLLNLLWWVVAELLDLPALVSPLVVYGQMGEVWQRGMSAHLAASLQRILWGIGVAMLMGLATAILMYRCKLFGRMMDGFLYFCYPVPKLALLPVVMLLAGLGDVAKVVMIVLIIYFQITINVRDSLRHIPKESFLTLTSLGGSRGQVLRHVLLPAILPEVLSTLRVAIGTAISVLFVTETYGTARGMGFFIVDAWMRLDYTSMYAGIVVLGMAGFVLFLLTDICEAYLCRWKGEH